MPGFLLMLGYFRIDFEYILFVGAGWCFLKLWIVLDTFFDVEVFQCVFFVGFWVNFLMLLPVDLRNGCRRLAAHLGLHTPHGATMMVGEHELNWKEGQAIVFDVPLMNKRHNNRKKQVVDVENGLFENVGGFSMEEDEVLRFQM